MKLDDGRYEQKYGGSPHRFKRMVHCGRLMGKPLMASLANKTKSLGVEPLEHLMLVDLIYDQNKVNGAWGFSYRTGEPIVISAKTTVISTGGAPQIHTLNDLATHNYWRWLRYGIQGRCRAYRYGIY